MKGTSNVKYDDDVDDDSSVFHRCVQGIWIIQYDHDDLSFFHGSVKKLGCQIVMVPLMMMKSKFLSHTYEMGLYNNI